jgi:hypothetical protein
LRTPSGETRNGGHVARETSEMPWSSLSLSSLSLSQHMHHMSMCL